MEGELQEDWEVVIERSGTTTTKEEEEENPKRLEEEEIEDGTQGMVTLDYFSIDNSNIDAIDEDGSVQSGSPGWIEPSSHAPYGPKLFSELWSDSSSDRLDDDDVNIEKSEESPVSVEGKSVSGGGGGGGGEERIFVWWKIPIDVFKYCVFRVNNHPLWSFSMAAAVVGFVMLGRRLYHMNKRRKDSTLQLKVLSLNDKNKAAAANHAAARLNEAAISLVKRVPIIRPALPSSVVGMNQWSMMSLR